MKCFLPVYITLFIILFSGCNRQAKHSLPERNNEPYIIDFDQCLDEEQAMVISEIADTVEYLELKTPEGVFVSRIWKIIPVDNFLFLKTTYGIFKFTREGEFVTEIGRNGQGPGEYSMNFDIAVDLIQKEILLADSKHVLFYDLDGNYLRMEKWGSLIRMDFSDSVLWVGEHAHRLDKFIAFGLNRQGDTIASMPNPHYGMKSLDAGMGLSTSKFLEMFYSYKGSLYLKGKEVNDTIFQLSGKNRTPYAFINMGKHKLPVEYEAWYSQEDLFKNGSRYWKVPGVAEDDRYLYLLAQRCNAIDGDNYKHNEENFRYIVYDKESGKGFVTKDNKGTRFSDDILGGPPIWPRWATDDYYMNVIEAHDLLDEVKKGSYILSPSLEKQLAGFSNSTNQLIVLCRRKPYP